MDHLEEKSDLNEQLKEDELAEVDLATFHEREAGRLILDPAYVQTSLLFFEPHRLVPVKPGLNSANALLRG
jgi:hypothetical protein